MKRAVCAGSRRIEYTLIQAARRDVLLQALPEGRTRVYAPKGMRLRDVDALVRQNAEKLAALHAQIDRRADEDRRARPVTEGARLCVEGRPRTLRLHAGAPRAEISEDAFDLWVEDPSDEGEVRAAIRSALSARALLRIRERIAALHPAVGGEYGRVAVRDQRSRWGSCSSKRNLNFNWKLIMAPPEALDYVVVHELCHLREFNHSPRFWARVRSIMPDYEFWKKWLKAHGGELGV